MLNTKTKIPSLFAISIVKPALINSFIKLNPKHQIRNPIMFTVFAGCVLVTIIFIQAPASSIFWIMIWLWFTLLFANFAEAMAEGRGKAQATTLRHSQKSIQAKKIEEPNQDSPVTLVSSNFLRVGDIVLVEAGDLIPSDGEVIAGIALVNESAITGESAPVIRESGGDLDSVTGGTMVLSDWLIIKITAKAGETFLDRIILMIEGAKRQKTPNELALNILLTMLTIIFLLVSLTLYFYSKFSVEASGIGTVITLTELISLFICLAPTTIGGLLSAIGIAGMDRMIQANVIAMSGRAIEAAGDVDILLLDKTGTITLGNRQATEFIPADGVTSEELAQAAQLASLSDETPEGRSIVVLAKEKHALRVRNIQELNAVFMPFSAETRMSGVNLAGRQIRKGAADAIEDHIKKMGGHFPVNVRVQIEKVARNGETPLIVVDGAEVLGVIRLKDIIKGGIKERFAALREMGIKTIMITGDNTLTGAAIAAETGVDDYFAQSKPEDKLKFIRQLQAKGHLVAMTGDGTNDAPALAQADVAVVMNTGTQEAKEAGNIIDLDSNPTKLIEIVAIGKQLLMTRGALTTFSIANDIAKYFAIIPAAFVTTYPALEVLNIMHLSTPTNAVLAAVIFNALTIVGLIPLALKGVRYRCNTAAKLLRNNLLIYGLGGFIAPFIGIKLIDLVLT